MKDFRDYTMRVEIVVTKVYADVDPETGEHFTSTERVVIDATGEKYPFPASRVTARLATKAVRMVEPHYSTVTKSEGITEPTVPSPEPTEVK